MIEMAAAASFRCVQLSCPNTTTGGESARARRAAKGWRHGQRYRNRKGSAAARVVAAGVGEQQQQHGVSFGCRHEMLELDTKFPGSSLHNVTAMVRDAISKAGFREGTVTLASQHTTLAVTVNEYEKRLVEMDVRYWLDNVIAKPSSFYLHNDIEVRRLDEPEMPEDEPKNAHAHLQAISIGNSESVGVSNGELIMGTYQSLIAVELDGRRHRRLALTMVGEFSSRS